MIKSLKAIVLSDNNGTKMLGGEWGLSIYIESDKINILLDAGGSGLFADNAEKLGINLENVDYAVLSHAHYDHSIGIKDFFKINKKADFYFRESVDENCYHKIYFYNKYIGIPKHLISDYRERIKFVDGDYRLCEDIYLIGHNTPGLEEIGKRENMFIGKGLHRKIDNFSHEQSLVFDTEKGLIIFNSCSHGGASNIINEVSNAFPGKKVYAIIGGFHLFNKTDEEVRSFADKLSNTEIEYVCTGHCTKDRAYDILEEKLGDKMHKLKVGLVMEF